MPNIKSIPYEKMSYKADVAMSPMIAVHWELMNLAQASNSVLIILAAEIYFSIY